MMQPSYEIQQGMKGIEIWRNGVIMKSPKGRDVIVPTASLARIIVGEYQAQNVKIDFKKMPMTQLSFTALDIVADNADAYIQNILSQGACDLLCHRDTVPQELAQKQIDVWQPILDWAKMDLGIDMKIGTGLAPITQSPDTMRGLGGIIKTYNIFYLAGLSEVVSIGGSVILALAILRGEITAQQFWEASELESIFQASRWGVDAAQEQTWHILRQDLQLYGTFFTALRGGA